MLTDGIFEAFICGSGRKQGSATVGGFVEGYEICDMSSEICDFFANGCFKVLYAAFALRNFYFGC